MADHDLLNEILDVAPTAVVPQKTPKLKKPRNPVVVPPAPEELTPNSFGVSTADPNASTDITIVDQTAILDPEDREDPNELITDFDFTRKQIRDLIAIGQTAAAAALELAESGDSPGAYDVVGKVITAVVSANRNLLKLHETRKRVEIAGKPLSTTPGTPLIHAEKAVFIGKASDLIRELKRLNTITTLEIAPPVSSDAPLDAVVTEVPSDHAN